MRTAAPPRIDGKLDDAAWLLAPPDSRFTQNYPDEGKPPTQRTELRVLYDDDAIYIGVRCFDDHPKEIVERLTRRDRDTDADKVIIDISSKADHLSAYRFDLNVSGVLADGLWFNDTDFSTDWDGLWTGATSRDAHGWSAELAIRLRTLRYDGRSNAFGFQVRRKLQRRAEIDAWALIPREVSGEVSRYGKLIGLDHLRARRLVQIAPYVAGRLTLRNHHDLGDGLTPSAQMGVDMKIGLTPALTLDATVNPDFGQVEADQVILNLSTFEYQFPEKRPFFLEGTELFQTPTQLFYSRRIGLSLAVPTLAAGERQAEPVSDGRIWFAAKLSGLLTRRLSIAMLEALTDRRDGQIDLGRVRQVRLIDPVTNYALLRLKREFLSNSHIGITATAVNRFEPAGAAAPEPGGLCPNGVAAAAGRCTRDAYTAGIDTSLKTHDGKWRGFLHLVGSLINQGPTIARPDGFTVGSGDLGWGLNSDVGKYGGKNWLFHNEYVVNSPKLELNDLGFMRRSNVHHLHQFATLRTRDPWGPFQQAEINAELIQEWSFSGEATLSRLLEVNSEVTFKNLWVVYLEFHWQFPFEDDRETRDGAIVERGQRWNVEAYLRTDSRRKAVGTLWARMSKVLHGVSLESELTLSLRPIPALELDIGSHLAWTYGDPRWFDTLDRGSTRKSYQFGDLDSRSVDITLRGTYTFTPRLTLQVYAQLFLASGNYSLFTAVDGSGAGSRLPLDRFYPVAAPVTSPDFREGALNANVVLRWEWRPGATLIAVYTHSHAQTPFDAITEGYGRLRLTRFTTGPATDLFLLKLTAPWG